MKLKVSLIFLITIFLLVGCRRPYMKPKFYDTKANEVIFLIPMEEDIENQGSFNSKNKEYYDNALVLTTRVNIRRRWNQTGRLKTQGSYIDIDKLIVVDKTPISRTWTAETDTGTETRNQGFKMESKDSIAFTIGGVCTARIVDASAFLATYGEGASLAIVMDENIRTHFEKALNVGFADLDLVEGRSNKNIISQKASEETISLFKDRGIEIDTLGLTGGMVYADKQIQTNINNEFASKLLQEIRKNERLAQEEVNLQMIAEAEAKRQSALKFESTAEVQRKMVALENEKTLAEAKKIWAQKWNGVLPEKVLPEGSALMLNTSN